MRPSQEGKENISKQTKEKLKAKILEKAAGDIVKIHSPIHITPCYSEYNCPTTELQWKCH